MSETSLEFTMTGDTPNTVILTDAGATYGVKRNDTNAVVVAAGTPMVAGVPGVWTYTFTDPLAGLAYTYSIQYTFSDGAVGYISGIKSASVHSVAPTDIQKVFGTVNINTWADKDNTGDPAIISAAIDYAQTLAGRRSALRASELRAPLPATTSALYPGVQDYETVFAGILLYMGRGEAKDGSRGQDGAGPYQAMLDKAENDFTAVLVASREQSGIVSVGELSPAGIGGTNVPLIDRLPLQPFGYRYFGYGSGRWPY